MQQRQRLASVTGSLGPSRVRNVRLHALCYFAGGGQAEGPRWGAGGRRKVEREAREREREGEERKEPRCVEEGQSSLHS